MSSPLLSATALRRADLVELEPALSEALVKLLPFTAHSLYFPTDNTPAQPQWIARERVLLLPLWRRGDLLGVFMARGVDGGMARRLLPVLPALVDVCLDNLELERRCRCDALTGLALPHVLLDRMERDVDYVRARFAHSAGHEEGSAPLHRVCAGLVVVRCYDMRDLAEDNGHGFADALMLALAGALTRDLPAEVLAARTGDNEYTLHIPVATRAACRSLVAAVLPRLDKTALPHPVTGQPVCPRCVVGYALYPQDMNAAQLSLPLAEQARILLHKARLAATVAQERNQSGGHGRGMAYGRLLAKGGVVREAHVSGRVLVSLGRQVGAAEGLRFLVWASEAAPVCKGEVVLLEVRDTASVAEVLHLTDPACLLEVGDTMSLLAPTAPLHGAGGAAASAGVDAATGLLRHGDFLHRLAAEFPSRAAFALSWVRLAASQATPQVGTVALMAELCRETPFVFGGRYGEASLAFLHSGNDMDALVEHWRGVCQVAEGRGLDMSVGVAGYPCLHFPKAEMMECCRKAMDLALLLPKPRVGLFGSLALNISADKRYSKGDVFGAVEEYQMALLADAGNALAWNSLGVCMAALSRPHEARRYFTEALTRQPGDAATLYNLGTVCQSLGDMRAAARHYRCCVQANVEHFFAHIRLGQLAERAGRRGQAREYYGTAARLEAQGAVGQSGLALRLLAGVALRQRRRTEARECLHEALHRNPQDAAAMEMLAGLYLDGNEDPAMAEMLARMGVGLRPGHGPGWALLGRALRALGRETDACVAEAHAHR